MYRDRGTIYRGERVEVNGIDEFILVKLATFACKLSQYRTLYAHRDDRAQHLTTDLRLTCDPATDIRANDVVTVEHEGQTFDLIAGEAFRYPTHLEISMRRRKEAGQK